MTYESALVALADPTRREVFERLRAGPRAVGEIAEELPVSRPAVSQHLKVLKEAGLVADRAEGTRRVYYIDPQGLGPLRKWIDQSWHEALGAFQAELEKSNENPSQPSSKGTPDEPNYQRRTRSQKRSRQSRSRPRL
jgi:DNA-binding transcriptional ArsR family regulator